MGNLGPYEHLTTLAKSLGGVDKLLASIGKAAVLKAAGPLLATGVVAGVAGTKLYGFLQDKYRSSQDAGRVAEAELRETLEPQEPESTNAVATGDDSQEPGEPTVSEP